MTILATGILHAGNLESLCDAAQEIITPSAPAETDPDFELNRWYILRDYDGVRRLYLGTEETFARYVAACEGVN